MAEWCGRTRRVGEGWYVSVGVSVLVGVVSCVGAQPRALAPLLAEGSTNELKATAEHRNERMRVWGVFVSAGLKKVDRMVGRKSEPWNPYSSAVEVQQVKRTYPYVYLRAPDAKTEDGKLLCFFSLDALSDLADLKTDTAVIVTGDFQEYTDGGRTLVLNGCELSRERRPATTAAW